MAYALYEFMPYEAPELIDGASRRLSGAPVRGVALSLLVYPVAVGWTLLRPVVSVQERVVVVPYRERAAPPPRSAVAPRRRSPSRRPSLRLRWACRCRTPRRLRS